MLNQLFSNEIQAESKLLHKYAENLQTCTGPRYLTSPRYNKVLEIYSDGIERSTAKAELGNQHVPVAPILEIISLKVQSNNKYDHDYQVYGIVQLLDEHNNAHDIFHRESDDPETVSPGGNLSLTDSHGRPANLLLFLASSFKFRVHLRDAAADGEEIAMGDSDLLSVDNENIATTVVNSPDGTSFASVQYLTLIHGVIVYVEYWLIKEYLSTVSRSYSSYYGDIYGNITATILTQGGNVMSRPIFNKSPSESKMFNFDIEPALDLGAAMFALPACWSFQVKAELWDRLTNQQIVDDIFTGHHARGPCCVDRISVVGQDYHSSFIVNWMHAYDLDEDVGGHLSCGPEIFSIQDTPSELDNRRCLLSKDPCSKPTVMPHISGSEMVEVFSISITPFTGGNLFLYGTIKVGDILKPDNKSYCIFERNNFDPEPLSGDLKIKSLEWPTCSFNASMNFGMHLHLFGNGGLEICNGFLHRLDYMRARYDKGMSSMIRGEDGYATVHYAIFSNAVEARVKVTFIPNTCSDVLSCVVENIIARYSSFLYSSCIEKKFFQSTLFGDYRYPKLAGGGSVLLQKSVVAVPVDSSLILDMELQAKVVDDFKTFAEWEEYGTLEEVVDFEIDVGKTSCKRIEGKGFDVQVSVEWSVS